MVVNTGYRGGIELGFDYRVRLTGLSADEAEALGVVLARPLDDLAPLGLKDAATRARRKLLEAFPDAVRTRAAAGARQFRFEASGDAEEDERLSALVSAIRGRRIVRVRAFRPDERTMHPTAIVRTADGWFVEDALQPGHPERLGDCADINISSKTFALGR